MEAVDGTTESPMRGILPLLLQAAPMAGFETHRPSAHPSYPVATP